MRILKQPVVSIIMIPMVLMLLISCSANNNSIYREYTVGDAEKGTAKTVLIDAKQRAIISKSKQMVTESSAVDSPVKTMDEVIICAEPSPDALSALASTLSTSASVFSGGTEVEAALAGAITESAGQLGIRNATIQILRDGLYRQCEAYMNGVIDGDDYKAISRKYVSAMVTLLAVEQLTSAGAQITEVNPNGKVTAETSINCPSAEDETNGDGGSQRKENGKDSEATKVSASSEAPAPSLTLSIPQVVSQTDLEKVSDAVKNMVSSFNRAFFLDDTLSFCDKYIEREYGGRIPDSDDIIVQNCADSIMDPDLIELLIKKRGNNKDQVPTDPSAKK